MLLQSKKKTIYFPAVSVFKNNAGYQKLFIPSAPELLTFSPPNAAFAIVAVKAESIPPDRPIITEENLFL